MIKNLKDHFKRYGLLFLFGGLLYIIVEIFFTALMGEIFRYGISNSYWALIGITNLYVSFVGGALLCAFYYLNYRFVKLQRLHMWIKCLLGGMLLTAIEFSMGIFFNIILKWRLWDYTIYPIHFMGQIELIHSICWIFIIPFIIYLCNFFKWFFNCLDNKRVPKFDENLFDYYKQLFKRKG